MENRWVVGWLRIKHYTEKGKRVWISSQKGCFGFCLFPPYTQEGEKIYFTFGWEVLPEKNFYTEKMNTHRLKVYFRGKDYLWFKRKEVKDENRS